MKKNKFSFLVVASLLALSSLVGCNNTPASSGNGASSGNNNSQQTSSSTNPGENSNSSSNGNNSSPSSLVPSSSSQPGGNTSVPQPSSSASNPQPSSSQSGSSASSGPASSSQSGSSNSSSPNVKTEWTPEETALMGNHLHGLVLPFVNMPVSVTYSEYTDAITIASTENMQDGFLREYAALYDYDSGWEGGDASAELGLYPGLAYVFRKAVVNNGQTNYVVVYFLGATFNTQTQEMDYSPTGLFYLQASDPYLYQYPAEFISNWLKTTFGADIIPPALEAECYELDNEGVLLAYSNTNLESAYIELLKSTNKFIIKEQRDSEGYYVAYPNDGAYQIRFKYDENQKVMLIEVGEYKGWSSALVNKFFQKYNQTPIEIPALDIDGASYKFVESENNEFLAEQGYYYAVNATYTISKSGLTNAPLAEYVRKLRQAGFSVCSIPDSDGSINQYYLMKAIKDNNFYTLSLYYEKSPIGGGKPQIVMSIFATGQEKPGLLVNWPSDKIATFLGNDVTDVVPAYAGLACGFGFESNKYALVSINVDEIASASIKSDYADLLISNKFTLKDNKYISQNNQISIQLADPQGYGTYDIFQIRIDKIDNTPVNTPWPSNDVADAIASKIKLYDLDTLKEIPITDTIPALNVSSASECYVNDNYSGKFEIVIGKFASSIADLKAALKAAGWSEDPFYGFDTTINEYGAFISPNKQIAIYFDVVGNDLSLYVGAYWNQRYATWPTSEMSPVIAAWGVKNDIIPAFDSASYVEWNNPESAKKINIVVMVGRGLDQLFIDTYKDALSKAGYRYDESRSGYVTTNGELLIKVGISQLTTLPEINVEYIGPEAPVPAKDFKLVGLNGVWDYDESDLVFVDATKAEEVELGWYVKQSKVEFDVEIGTEFKVTDGTTWLGMSVVEEMGAEYFSEGDEGNIKANKAGHVDLYLKTYTDGRLGLVIRFEEATPELLPWPEEEINEFFEGDFDFVPEIKIADASYEIIETYDEEDGKYMAILVTVADAEDAMASAIQELENQFSYALVGDLYVSTIEGFPAYGFSDIEENSFIVVINLLNEEEAPEESTWEAAADALQEFLGEEYVVPNLEFDGIDSYEVEVEGDTIVLTMRWSDETVDIDAVIALVAAVLDDAGYRDFDYNYWNYETMIWFRDASYEYTELVFSNYQQDSCSNYGIVVSTDINCIDGERTEDTPYGYSAQYLVSEVSFSEGDKITFINFATMEELVGDIVENPGEYLRYDAEHNCYIVLQDFSANIYIKLQYGADSVWLGIIE